MNIFAFLKERSQIIYGAPLNEIEEKLAAGRYALLDGSVYMDNGMFLKCTGEIYQTASGAKVPSAKLRSANQCYNVTSCLGIRDCNIKACGQCHLKAIRLYRDKQLKKRRK